MNVGASHHKAKHCMSVPIIPDPTPQDPEIGGARSKPLNGLHACQLDQNISTQARYDVQASSPGGDISERLGFEHEWICIAYTIVNDCTNH